MYLIYLIVVTNLLLYPYSFGHVTSTYIGLCKILKLSTVQYMYNLQFFVVANYWLWYLSNSVLTDTGQYYIVHISATSYVIMTLTQYQMIDIRKSRENATPPVIQINTCIYSKRKRLSTYIAMLACQNVLFCIYCHICLMLFHYV